MTKNKLTAVPPKVNANKPVLAKDKAKPIAFINWAIKNAAGEVVLKSSKGFSLFDNEYLTLEERTLVDLAKDNDGVATIAGVELRVVLAVEKPTTLSTAGIQLVKKAA